MTEDKYKLEARAQLEELRLLAIEKGITEAVISERSGLQQPNVNRMLNARYIPRLDNYLKLRDAIWYSPPLNID